MCQLRMGLFIVIITSTMCGPDGFVVLCVVVAAIGVAVSILLSKYIFYTRSMQSIFGASAAR